MSKALKLALAYTYATGCIPKGIHVDTWSNVYRMCDTSNVLNYRLSPEALAMIEDHPLRLAHDFLTRRGFKAARSKRGTSHYVSYRDGGGTEASAFRSGFVSIRKGGSWRVADEDKYTPEQIKKELSK